MNEHYNNLITEAEEEASRRCGLSDILYDSLVQESYAAILASAPSEIQPELEAALRERGYNPDRTPYEVGEGECDLTGIEVDYCPCGRHP